MAVEVAGRYGKHGPAVSVLADYRLPLSADPRCAFYGPDLVQLDRCHIVGTSSGVQPTMFDHDAP